jgi:DNA-binding XRE family transcriptional regulator
VRHANDGDETHRARVTDAGVTHVRRRPADTVHYGMKRHKLVARRRQLGESQTAIAHAVGVERTTYARWEQGVTTPQLWNRRRLAEVLQVDEHQMRDLLDERPTPGDGHTHRRDVLKLGVTFAMAPDLLTRQLREAAIEAVSFTSRSTTSVLGRGVIEHLQLAVADVARSYSRAAPHELFAIALTYRRQVDQLLRGQRTLREARELYTCAGWLSENLAWLAHDLGSPLAADAYCVDAYEHADQAGHDELCAWAMDARASIAMYSDRPAAGHDAALAGLRKAPAGHPLGVRLHAQAARASARLGDHDSFRAAFGAARQGYDRLPSRAPDRFGKDTAKLATYAITSYATT